MQAAAGASVATGTGSARRRPLTVALVVLTLAVLAVDQATKALAVARLRPDDPVPLVGELLQLHLIRNPGAAFSLGTGATWVLTVVAAVIVVVVVRSARRLGSRAWAVALGLLLGGALGNLVDRLVRTPGLGRGHVVDFIAYGHLFIGNVADVAIVVAAALMALLSLRGVGLDGRRGDRQAAGSADAAEPEGGAGRG
ncbi:signal peptidase II [Angustibacter aerolatus]